jgi:diguanylate cyclase (GGDEF)-like protein
MGKNRKKAFVDWLVRNYIFLFFSALFLLCLVSIGIMSWSVKRAEKLHSGLVRDQIYSTTKIFLHDTVQNTITNIRLLRTKNMQQARDMVDFLADAICRQYQLQENALIPFTENLVRQQKNRDMFVVVLSLRQTGKDVFSTVAGNALKKTADYTREADIGPYHLFCQVNGTAVDAETKNDAAGLIHSEVFDNDSYIWVNEIVNWSGGNNYAIRRIHPNLIHTEGAYLSTRTPDVTGKLMYQIELDGIKQYGELYYRYYFLQKNSNIISEKLTYSALYPEYNWIVSMGIPIHDIDFYADKVYSSSKIFDSQISAISASLFIFAFGFVIVFFMLTGKRFIRHTGDVIRQESNIDPLTGIPNRRMGHEYLVREFQSFMSGETSPVLFSVDIDNFKHINDTLGHETGDYVLKFIVERISQTIRGSDSFFRWGGEEFLIIYKNIRTEDIMQLADRLNRQVSGTPVSVESPVNFHNSRGSGKKRNFCLLPVSISVGITWFGPSDAAYHEALRRADIALYRAKAEGKDCSRIEPPHGG